MIRITTPQHIFTFPQDPSGYAAIRITYKQCGKIILQKTKEDMTFGEDNAASFILTQSETARFRTGFDVQFQAHVKVGDSVFASEIMTLSVSDVLDNEPM